MMKKSLSLFILALMTIMTSLAQESGEQFTVATLNVDGLPQKLLVVNVNADGPGDAGTARIGKYLVKKGYDLVMMQEDFSYHGVLSVWLEDDYKMDEWSGTLYVLDGSRKVDFLHLQNHRYACDGLLTAWKNDLQVTPAGRTPWIQNFGKFSHALDEMVTKGFRRYEVTLRSGDRIVVYNMHMDATDEKDEAEGKAGPDHDARMAQWAQLKDDVLQHLDSRPIIITGDMNSLYGRDDVKGQFIDAINQSGRGMASDVWVELQHSGIYPSESITEATASDETLDKIIYINPTMGTNIQPVAITIDREGYLYDGKPLGDHFPVAATFQLMRRGSGIEELNGTATGESQYYNLNGQHVSMPQKGIYIEQQGKKAEKRIIK
jgi:endonuclease/exonuclease/phosphatase family metal-dependent hydrolase